MHLLKPLENLIAQLQELLLQLTDEQYCLGIPSLQNATIGQHVRHVVEFFDELYNGYAPGIVNYDNRKRDVTIETKKTVALKKMQDIVLNARKENKTLLIEGKFLVEDTAPSGVQTNYERELLYNIEHTIHHMALIRVAVQCITILQLPPTFGIAVSTSLHQSCAQ